MSFQAMAWAVKQVTPDPQSKLLLLMLANHSGRHETDYDVCWPSIKLLAEECSMSEDTVSRRIQVLEKMGLVMVTNRSGPDGKTTSNLYKLPVPDTYYMLGAAGSGGGTRSQRGTPPPVAVGTYNTKPINEPIPPIREKPRSVWELTKILEAKQKMADHIKFEYSSQVSTGRHWRDETKRQKFKQLRAEIQQLQMQLASM